MPRYSLHLWLVAILLLTPYLAQARIKSDEKEQIEIDYAAQMINDTGQALRGTPQAQWTDEALSKYLICALNAAQQALIVYVTHLHRLPESAAALREEGILSQWPGNPLANWAPLDWQLYEPWMEFKPGALVLQTVPGALCTQGQEGAVPVELNPSGKAILIWQPYSFLLSINGPSAEYAMQRQGQAIYDWGVVPLGSVDVVSFQATTRKSDYEGHQAYLKQKAHEHNE